MINCKATDLKILLSMGPFTGDEESDATQFFSTI